ncbi:IS21-like element ISYen2A family transposase (plasmid) [Yersinia enterocolitica subsp. palearctica]|uniref:IS21-like element ISYen2A family transposase n=5 Tax=Yersinia enterocolitica TaxID=630 RepID=UPI001063D596|nr:IS21-like element ISYen2A family transposase [Yersinia enterocolitica]QBQ01355.1 IS21-like element ISYen2A family transposase [Yersinia enterocolitica subsp. palearctica]
MLCMETILKVRRLSLKQGLSQRAIAKQLQISRHTVSKYLAIETKEPPAYKRTQTHYPKLGEFIPVLKQRLTDETKLPAKQRLTARRHFERLRTEGYQGAYCAVASFIRQFKEQYQPAPHVVFIPQRFSAADAYQFDCSFETVKLNGLLVKLKVAHFRLCHSRAFFIRAYPNEKLDMLIDAHNHAFSYFGGTPNRGIYDNMKTAVKHIGMGKERIFNDKFLSMMNHFIIEPVACTPASGWEKGQVERQVRTLRKQLFEPTLAFNNIDELNSFLLDQCHQIIQTATHPEDRSKVINTLFCVERTMLAPYSPYTGGQFAIVQINSLSCFDGHKYSVPNNLAGKKVTLKTTATEIKIIVDSECVAQHQRSFIKNQTTYNPWHYLSTLKRKPGALRNGEPFINWDLPKPVKELQQHLLKRPKGDRAMVQLLSLLADYGEDLGVTAAAIALDEGVPTVEAVLNIIHRLTEPVIPTFKINDIPLNIPPQANCQRYNTLLKGVPNGTA